ncbi:unnamed protein product, partial [Polarella glacialis]
LASGASPPWTQGTQEDLDDRQKHDIGLLSKAEENELRRRKKERKKQQRAERAERRAAEGTEGRDASFEELVGRYCGEEETQEHSKAQLKQALKAMAQQLEEAKRRAAAGDESLRSAEERLAQELEARTRTERLRAEAVQRVEELELTSLEIKAERQRWKQRELELLSESARQGNAVVRDQESRDRSDEAARDARIKELEGLLKEAIVRGARLGRARADVEGGKADLERKLAKLKEVARSKIRRERRHHDNEFAASERRVERAEDRLAEFLRVSAAECADGVLEVHMQHLATVGRSLAHKVDEQAEIIEVLQGLLQDHKDFIRQELGSELLLPASPKQRKPPADVPPKAVARPHAAERATSSLTEVTASSARGAQSSANGAGTQKSTPGVVRDESSARASALGIIGPIGEEGDDSGTSEVSSDELSGLEEDGQVMASGSQAKNSPLLARRRPAN